MAIKQDLLELQKIVESKTVISFAVNQQCSAKKRTFGSFVMYFSETAKVNY